MYINFLLCFFSKSFILITACIFKEDSSSPYQICIFNNNFSLFRNIGISNFSASLIMDVNKVIMERKKSTLFFLFLVCLVLKSDSNTIHKIIFVPLPSLP